MSIQLSELLYMYTPCNLHLGLEKNVSSTQQACSSVHPEPNVHSLLISITIKYFSLFWTLQKWETHYRLLCFWLLLLNVISGRVSHIVRGSSSWLFFMAWQCSFLGGFTFLIFLLLFNYNCSHFPALITLPCPTHTHIPHLVLPSVGFVHWSFIHVLWLDPSLSFHHYPPPTSLWSLSVCPMFPCLWFYFAH